MTPHLRRLSFLFVVLIASFAAPEMRAQRERFPADDLAIIEKRWPDTKRTSTSLRYQVLKEGDSKGPTPLPGMMVKVLYKGSLLDGKVFDEALDPAKPLTIRVGRDNLVPGWEEALSKMHRGEKWLLVIPYELAYGTAGRPPDIPRRATLVFEMELLDFAKDFPPPSSPPAK